MSEAIDENRAILKRMLSGRVPMMVNAGGHSTAVAYKKAVEAARKTLNSPRSTLIAMQGAIQALRAYQD
jgi:hypothetical protein